MEKFGGQFAHDFGSVNSHRHAVATQGRDESRRVPCHQDVVLNGLFWRKRYLVNHFGLVVQEVIGLENRTEVRVLPQNSSLHVGNIAKLSEVVAGGQVTQAIRIFLDGRHTTVAIPEIVQCNQIIRER